MQIAATMMIVVAWLSTSIAVAAEPKAPAVPIGDADGDGDVDLDDLAKRVGDSKAIGLVTKISLKRQIDGFKSDLKAFHSGSKKSTLAQLHERYNRMVDKLRGLLQAKDPGLAREISQARNFLWDKLADPTEFKRM